MRLTIESELALTLLELVRVIDNKVCMATANGMANCESVASYHRGIAASLH